MSNMSYCRFHNTYQDLMDCFEHMDEDLSEEENQCREELYQLCQEIVKFYSEDDIIELSEHNGFINNNKDGV